MRSLKRNARIVSTVGPASRDLETLTELIKAGVNIVRVNMSHGTHEAHATTISNVRKASGNVGKEVGILLDLQGPKIRVDKLPEDLVLEDGTEWVIGETKHMKGYPEHKDCFIPTIYDKLVSDCKAGERVLFDDGLIIGEVTGKDRDVLKIKIAVGGVLKSNKGINLPDTKVTAPSFTDKDAEDLAFGLTQDIDYIALSFVRTKQDILDVKEMLKKEGKDIPIVSKIEKPQALENIEEILEVSEALMIARGDMAVEVGNHLVPAIQKNLITRCNELGKPVITATQMMESMITNASPTRAEASDVANAVWDGTDAVMLSAETAAGKYPVQAVAMMSKIIIEAEKTPRERPRVRDLEMRTVSSATMVAASMMAEKLDAKKILAVTNTGNSCREMSRYRSFIEVVGITDNKSAARKMCLYWGINPYIIEDFSKANSEDFDVIEEVKGHCDLEKGDRVVIVKGDEEFFKKGSSNTVKVDTI